MTHLTFLLCGASTLLPLGLITAQGGEESPIPLTPRQAVAAAAATGAPQRAVTTVSPENEDVWMVPVHTGPADPVGGAYGLWAAGPNYKASFHDGFVFYPILGTSYPRNLPMRWTTESVTVGTSAIALRESTAPQTSAWRVEYRHGDIVEAYDIRKDGVEQSFVLERLIGRGDLVIRGQLVTDLVAAPALAAHQGLVLSDQRGTAIVRYGEAFAIDADGQRAAITTAFDGRAVELTVPRAWLDAARFPVTVDPLTSSVVIATWGGTSDGQPSYPDVARDDETNELLTCYSRAASAGDYDTFARITDDRFAGTTLVFNDVTTSWSTRYNQSCFVGGADRWALALGREFGTSAAVRVYLHDKGNRTLNSGTTLFMLPPVGFQEQVPSIGGTGGFGSNPNAYLAWRRDAGTGSPNTGTSEVWGCAVDCVAGTFGTPSVLETSLASGTYDAEWPCVTKDSEQGDWLVVWQEYNNTIAGDDWDVIAQRIAADGSLLGRDFFGPAASATHKFLPKVDGSQGRYLVSFAEVAITSATAPTWGTEIRCQRGNWTGAAGAFLTRLPEQTLRSAGSAVLTTGSGNRGVAYDHNTDSHWAVIHHDTSWDVFGHRVGYNGGPVESVTVYSSTTADGFSPSCVYNDDDYTFAIVWATNEAPVSNQPVRGAELQYFAAQCVQVGVGCRGSLGCTNSGFLMNPYAGSEFFSLSLSGAIPSTLYVPIIAAAPVPGLPLGGGCFLYLNLALPHVALPAIPTSATGTASLRLSLPDTPVVIGDIWAQFFALQGGAIVSSDAQQVQIR